MTPFNLPINIIPHKEIKLIVKSFPKENDMVTTKSTSLKLSKKISEGGEGIIYTIHNNPSIVCKIYHPEKLTNLRKEKIELMISKKISYEGICWPLDLVFNKSNEFVGYIMPAASGKTMQTSMFIKPQLLKNFPNFKRRDLVGIAISFLEKMKFLHSMNIIVGDINALNILVETNGKIWFVDTDSYQIENFPCPVGTVNFTAPEIQGKDYANFIRTKNHELFAIATMIFMILFPGKPPYSQQGGESQSDNIKKMNFPYWCSEKSEVNPPEGSWNFIWSHLTAKVKENFCMTFKNNQRKNIEDWLEVLKKYKWAIENSYSTDELFPDGFPIRDPEETICSGCGTKHINSKTKIIKMQALNKGVLCNNCFKEIKLKKLARQSQEQQKKIVQTNKGGHIQRNSYSYRTRNSMGAGGITFKNRNILNQSTTNNSKRTFLDFFFPIFGILLICGAIYFLIKKVYIFTIILGFLGFKIILQDYFIKILGIVLMLGSAYLFFIGLIPLGLVLLIGGITAYKKG